MNKRFISAASAAVLLAAYLPTNAFAADKAVQHKVTVLDFDGKVMAELMVDDGGSVDLSSIDVSVLSSHPDIYTEIAFNDWSRYPAEIYEDTTIKALSKKMTLSIDSMPEHREYYSKTGDVLLDGLHVTITVLTQVPKSSTSSSIITTKEVVALDSKCYSSPATLDEAFADGDTTKVNIFTLGEDKPIVSYDISYFNGLGDVDYNGGVDSSDASLILRFYANISSGKTAVFEDDQEKRCDVDRNGLIDSSDASLCLKFYAEASTGDIPTWESLIYQN